MLHNVLFPAMLPCSLSELQITSQISFLTLNLPGASTGDPTHDKVMRRDLTGKADQDSRDPLELLEHLPQKSESVCLTIL